MGVVYYSIERRCKQCGQLFWAKTKRNEYCHQSCRQRAARAKGEFGLGATELGDLCTQIAGMQRGGPSTPRKLLPRLFRAVARELYAQGWDPIELLLITPDDPVSEDDQALGGFEGLAPRRRRWLFPPQEELAKLELQIRERKLEGSGVGWYEKRRDQLRRLLTQRAAVGG